MDDCDGLLLKSSEELQREHLERLIAEEKPSGKSLRDTIIVPSMQAKPANKQIFTF